MSIEKLEKQYKLAKNTWDDFIASKQILNERFIKFFHIRPTNGYFRIVCTYENRLAMRTMLCRNIQDLAKGLQSAYDMIKDFDIIENLTKKAVKDKYNFNIYSAITIKEYNVQAAFINYMKNEGFYLLASEFNFKSGKGKNKEYDKKIHGDQRIDILALKENEIWIFEVKNGDTTTQVGKQVNLYKEILQNNITVIKRLLQYGLFKQLNINENYIIKTGVVYTTENNQNLNDVDGIWKIDINSNKIGNINRIK